ncbi:hypothetical protein [Nostoc sp.]|uniref:hypothetical protein n=1 Tax=Nostoc sp. TaxID=1180 RepID=UPI002FF758FF
MTGRQFKKEDRKILRSQLRETPPNTVTSNKTVAYPYQLSQQSNLNVLNLSFAIAPTQLL